jgi:hypothetical protein
VDEVGLEKQYSLNFQILQKDVKAIIVDPPAQISAVKVINGLICTVELVEVTYQGKANLEFNTEMKADIDIKMINEEILDIYIES